MKHKAGRGHRHLNNQSIIPPQQSLPTTLLHCFFLWLLSAVFFCFCCFILSLFLVQFLVRFSDYLFTYSICCFLIFFPCVCKVFNPGHTFNKQTNVFPSSSWAFVCASELAQDTSYCLWTQQACLIHEAASKLSYAPCISHCFLSSRCWIVSPKLSDTLSAGWMALVGS